MIKEEIKKQMSKNCASPFACSDEEAIRLQEEVEDIRAPFSRDADRIIYSLSFTRYIDKTQVFSFNDNDHISKRIVHVQFVSKIARTIGRALGLNEDLIEAIALGHDLGHTPIGHVGETILNEISKEAGLGNFNHNVHSVRMLMNIEKNGNGNNLTLQVLDGIMAHNGELPRQKVETDQKNWDQFLELYRQTYLDQTVNNQLMPMTLEGAVVRVSDMIAYLGRDIEDALHLGLITRDNIPPHIAECLGTNNREIINTLVLDIINESFSHPYISFSSSIFEVVQELKNFNYQNIYSRANDQQQIEQYRLMFKTLYAYYLEVLKDKDSDININYVTQMSDNYRENKPEQIVLDYLAGMTDDFFTKEYNKISKLKYNKGR